MRDGSEGVPAVGAIGLRAAGRPRIVAVEATTDAELLRAARV